MRYRHVPKIGVRSPMNVSLVPLRPSQTATCLFIGSIALLILGIQPVVLAPLVIEERILEADVGYLVMAEMVTIAIGTLIGVPLLRRAPARSVAFMAGVIVVVVNLLQMGRVGLVPLLTLRSVAGVAEGVLVSVALVAISLSVRPERLAALFLAGQTFLQLAVATFLPRLVYGGSRADAALATLAVAGAVACIAVVGLPRRLSPAESDEKSGAINLASGLGLISTGLYMGALVVVWIFFGVWLARNGHPPTLEATTVSICLGAQIFGALVAAKVSDRLPNASTIAICAVGEIILVGLMLRYSHSGEMITGLVIAFGFLWLFALPSFAGLLIEIDPERRAVLFFAAAQLIGSALVPTIGASVVQPGNVDGAFYLGMATFAAAGLTAPLAIALHRRTTSLV